jgi:NADPH:quinone reductase-like Zn-dependent oxidoreductase
MKAVVHDRFGKPDVLKLEEVENPEPSEDGVLVRVRAASLNRADWYGMTGTPYVGRFSMGLRKPKGRFVGIDFAGTVDSLGVSVSEFEAGDEVFGARHGALAEYVAAGQAIARKPANLTFEEAATIPVAGVTALQGLRDKGGLQQGQRVLINGATGGVGTFAVQIARALGAEVTGVCSTSKVELVRSLGAGRVLDYTREDFTRNGARYDLILDVAGSRSWADYKRALEPQGVLVIVGGPSGRMLGPLGHIGRMLLASKRGTRRAVFFIAKPNRVDLNTLRELAETGRLTPAIDHRYDLPEAADAFRYIGKGHARGKVVITV